MVLQTSLWYYDITDFSVILHCCRTSGFGSQYQSQYVHLGCRPSNVLFLWRRLETVAYVINGRNIASYLFNLILIHLLNIYFFMWYLVTIPIYVLFSSFRVLISYFQSEILTARRILTLLTFHRLHREFDWQWFANYWDLHYFVNNMD